MFAGDHDTAFPSAPDMDGQANAGGGATGSLSDANEAFANLIPNYLSNESPFGNTSSAWCKKDNGSLGPDNNIKDKSNILEKGENQYAYVGGLNEISNSSYPIIADGFAGSAGKVTNPAYSKTEGEKGAVWKGRYAIVVKVDGSATVELTNSTTLTVNRKPGTKNYFTEDKSTDDPWLVGCSVYNPK
jgi:hypothetical protein